jgi:hypothetical protein
MKISRFLDTLTQRLWNGVMWLCDIVMIGIHAVRGLFVRRRSPFKRVKLTH